jgi:hypothetical protein
MRRSLFVLLTVGAAATARAQAGDSLAARIAAAAALPALADEIRGAGVANRDLATMLEIFGERRIPATDARLLLDEEWKAAREHGPVPGLGRFVRGRLDEGLRGRALADAIRAEHAARGTGGDRAGAGSRDRAPAVAPSPADRRKARGNAPAAKGEPR